MISSQSRTAKEDLNILIGLKMSTDRSFPTYPRDMILGKMGFSLRLENNPLSRPNLMWFGTMKNK